MARKKILKPKVGSGLTFEGSHCTKDCSGHRAGYIWQTTHQGQQSVSKSSSFNNGAMIRNNLVSKGLNPITPAPRNTQTGQFQKFVPKKK